MCNTKDPISTSVFTMLFQDHALSPTCKLVVLGIFSFEKNEEGFYNPSISEIAKRCSINKRVVDRAIKVLKTCDYIKVVKPAIGLKPRTNRYYPNTEIFEK